MTYREFIEQLKKGNLHSAYLFAGNEEFLVEDCVQRLTEHVLEPDTREFNYDVFYGGEADAGKIIDTACAYPMLAAARLVLVKDFDKMNPSGLSAISKYLEKPSPTTRLVLISRKAASKAKSRDKIRTQCCHVEVKAPYENQIPTWIKNHLKDQGVQISYNACLLLQAYVGNGLRNIVNEIGKIRLNVKSANIEESDVQRVVGLSRTFSVFDLNEALGNKDIHKALLILNHMLDSGEVPTRIVAAVSRHYIKLFFVKGASSRGKSEREITQLTGIPSFFLKKTKAMAARYSSEQFEQIFQCLLEADLTLKTSRQSPKVALQTTFVKMMR